MPPRVRPPPRSLPAAGHIRSARNEELREDEAGPRPCRLSPGSSYLGKLLSAIVSQQPHPPREQHLPQPPDLICTAPAVFRQFSSPRRALRKSDSGKNWDNSTRSPSSSEVLHCYVSEI